MDGDVADVRELLALCERHDAWLVLDDAHGMGVLGATGRGALEFFAVQSPRIVYMATLGKALGGYGAFVAGAPEVVEWLVQRARTYIYSTALPPVTAAAAIAALDLVDAQPELVSRLRQRIAEFRAASAAIGLRLAESTTAIQPIVVGDAARAVDASQRLLDRGFLVPAIRPPTVPEGTSRLRVSLSAAHSPEDVERLANALAATLAS
jgi:8-amino-7-oxononanoate synthase